LETLVNRGVESTFVGVIYEESFRRGGYLVFNGFYGFESYVEIIFHDSSVGGGRVLT
jgi:hypothetical protein